MTVAKERGGRLWAAQMTDPRYFAEIAAKAEALASSGKPSRPGLEGFTAEVDALYQVANQIRLLMRVMGAQGVDMIEGPEGPLDLIKAEYESRSASLVDAALGYPV